MLHSPYRQLGSSTDTRSVIVSMATDHMNDTNMDHGMSFSKINILLPVSVGSCKAVGGGGNSASCSPLAGQV